MPTDKNNSYKSAGPYLAYTRNTDEKQKLHRYISEVADTGDFPIRKNMAGNILDLGCGNGVNTIFLAKQFTESKIDAIDRSEAQVAFAKENNSADNINYRVIRLEDMGAQKKYDFILASHVLQYIDCDLEKFIKKALSLLKKGGEIWFVQQTKKGMAEIIEHQKPYLANPRFKDWGTYEDFKIDILGLLEEKSYKISESLLGSLFKKINFKNPSDEDKQRLEFIFCLDRPFDEESDGFKKHLALLKLNVNNGRIAHPNKILRIKK